MKFFFKNKLWNLIDEYENNYTERFFCRREKIDNILINQACGNILEVGCGEGRFLAKLKPIDKVPLIYGIDISMYGLHEAHRKGICVLRADGEKLPFKKDTFDTVMSANGALKEMKLDILLAEIYRVLKPGGVFAFDTYNERPLKKQIKYKIRHYFGISDAPLTEYPGGIKSIKELKMSCLRCGFKIIALYNLYSLPFFPYGVLLKGALFSQIDTHFIGILRKIK